MKPTSSAALFALRTAIRPPSQRMIMLCTANTDLLSTDQEMMPARNAIDAHAQDFVVNEELLLPTLSAFAQ